jgi:2-amino-4-ketopentanoate thiolase beta subunit
MSRYNDLMERRGPILRRALGIDYESFERGPVEFDYEGLLGASGLTSEDVARIQRDRGVGRTPMLELRSISELVRTASAPGMGARIFVKDEAANPSGSFKDRRAALSAHFAAERGYAGIVAATSGNYGAAVASQAAQSGLNSIIVQEAFDSRGVGQPEILEKARKCEALGAEVLQTTVGPELFYMLLSVLDETGYFNASLYTPMSIQGIETLGIEIVENIRAVAGREPALILATHAGGGMCTGVARGVRSAGAATQVVGVSVDLNGLHMASDEHFNRKSFTTGHTGFSMPFTAWPDRVDVPRNAARALRYLDRFVTVTQGAVFYATEVLAQMEGLERGPAGNTSLAAALAIARELAEDEIVVISETEYTGAGKTPWAQLEFAESLGVEVTAGSGSGTPGESIVLPLRVADVTATDVPLDRLRASYVHTVQAMVERPLTAGEISFVAEDCNTSVDEITAMLAGARSA